MKKLIVYITMVSFLFSQTEAHELLKLPFLLFHYSEHLQQDQQLSFVDFLSEHYSGNHECKAKTGHPSDMPFKDCHGCSIVFACAIMPSFEEITFSVIKIDSTPACTYGDQFHSEKFADIWQPPKL